MIAKSFFIPLYLSLILSVFAQCVVKTSENNNDVYTAFQNSTCRSASNVLILVDKDASCSSTLVGSAKTLEIRGFSTKIIHAKMNLTSFTSVKLNGLVFERGSAVVALSITNSPATVDRCIFFNNTAGGIKTNSPLHVTSSNFTYNTAKYGAGGGIYGNSTVDVTSSNFTSNSAKSGGGIYGGSSVTATLSKFTSNNALYGSGGGIYGNSIVNTTSSTFTSNSAAYGGGIFGYSNVSVTFSTFTFNNATQNGGGIDGNSGVSVTSSTFTFNNATQYGGGIDGNSVSVTSCNFTSNSAAQEGGGIKGDVVSVTSSNFISNSARYGGGAISGGNSGGSTVSVTSSNFTSNSAQFGGGISTHNEILINNTVFHNNNASLGSGGGIYLANPTHIKFFNTEFIKNEAQLDGGGIAVAPSPQLEISLNNIKTFGNKAGNNGGSISISSSFDFMTLDSLSASGDTADGNGGSISIQSLNQNGKVLIQKSNFENCSASLGGALFISGKIDRVILDNSMWTNNSATEFSGGAISVRLKANSFSFSNSTFERNRANYQGGAVVFQDTAQIGNLTMENVIIRSNSASVGGSFTLRGEFWTVSILDCFIVRNQGLQGAGFELSGNIEQFNIHRSNFSQNDATRGGAAIFAQKELLINIDRSTFEGNGGLTGGAIYLGNFVNPSITNSSFLNNQATEGGALWINNTSIKNPVVTNCIFTENVASSKGGALFVQLQVPTAVFAQNNTFERNIANSGGAISITIIGPTKRSNFEVVLQNLNFSNNRAILNGGGIEVVGDIILTNCSFELNNATKGNGVAVQNGTLYSKDSSFENSNIYLTSSGVLVGGLKQFVFCESGKHVNSGMNNSFSCQNNPDVKPGDPPNPIPLIIGTIFGVGGFLLLVIILASILIYRRQQRAKPQANAFSMIDFSKINMGEAKKSVIDFDNIKIQQKIGAGAFGLVYKGKWRETMVAVKQLKSENVNEQQLKDFLREVAILKGLRPHPNVILFLGITFPPQPLSLVTEFAEGGGLYEYLRNETVSDEMKMSFIVGIARGILHLHLEGVIHRDLAVRNILLNRSLEPKVSDFGLSREHSDPEKAAQTATTLGPLKWMAPESIFDQNYSVKSDSFSFGVVAWEIIYIEEPWAALTPMDAALQIREGKRLFIDGDCNLILRRIMNECWNEKPEKRPDFSAILNLLDPSAPLSFTSPKPIIQHSNLSNPQKFFLKTPKQNCTPISNSTVYSNPKPSRPSERDPLL